MKKNIIHIIAIAVTTAVSAQAGGGDWGGGSDSRFARVGWAVVKLEPKQDAAGHYVPTEFSVDYQLDRRQFPDVDSLQAVVFDNVDFTSPHVDKVVAQGMTARGDTQLRLKLIVSAPHTYHVAYGPRVGHFDPGLKTQHPNAYKLGVTSEAGGVTWVSYWIGDATIARQSENGTYSPVSFVAPDIIFDPTVLDLLGVPEAARRQMVQKTQW